MSHTIQFHIAAAFFARVFLGMLFFFQGLDAVFRVKLKGVIETFEGSMARKGIPSIFIRGGAYFTSYAELLGGFLLLIGFVKYYAMYLLGIDLLLAALAFSLLNPMWNLEHAFPRLSLLLFLLLIPSSWDVLSIDYCWSLIKFIHSF